MDIHREILSKKKLNVQLCYREQHYGVQNPLYSYLPAEGTMTEPRAWWFCHIYIPIFCINIFSQLF